MANEIHVSLGMTVAKSYLSTTFKSETTQHTLTGTRSLQNVQAVGTTHEAIVVGDLASAGFACFRNLDSTNYVEIGVDVAATFYPFVKLLTGERAFVPLSTLTIYGRANTAAVNLSVTILER